MSENKLVHLEALRIWAIYWVMFNHTGKRGFELFMVAEDSPFFWLYMFISIACKFAVPVFFMISGALLLGKEESIGTIYKKRVFRIAVVLVVISLATVLFNCVRDDTSFHISEFFKNVYSENISTPLWFLYAYLALLIMLPLLRRLAQGMRGKEYLYLAGISILLVGVIPILQYRFSLGEVTMGSHLNGALFTATGIVYFLMGYFFEHVLPEKYYTWRNAGIAWILTIICIVVCCYMTFFQAQKNGEFSQTFFSSLIAIPSYTVYFTGKLFFMKRDVKPKIQRLICLIGGTTFGIYLLERFLRFGTVIVYTKLQPVIRSMPACLIWILVALLVGFVVVWVLKKIPGIKKFI